MSVYVDELLNTEGWSKKWPYKQACHMTADTEEELHVMAAKLGLKRSWFQNHHVSARLYHYDLTASKRVQALRYGAIALTWRAKQQMEAKPK